MDLTYIILMILMGLIFIIVEVLIIPGSSIVGFLGFGTCVAAIYMAYWFHGNQTGTLALIGSGLISGGFLYYAIKHKSWELFSLKKEIDGKIDSNVKETTRLGMEGKAISNLRPYGNAEFNDETFEVVSLGSFVDAGTLIRIVKIEREKIFVEPITF